MSSYYNEICKNDSEKYTNIETGDLILMSSITTFAIVVKFSLANEFNHVSVAVWIDPQYLPNIVVNRNTGILTLIEFNGDDYINVLTGMVHHGNRLVSLSEMDSKYKKLSVLKLQSKYKTHSFYKNVESFISEHCNYVVSMDHYTPILKVLGYETTNLESRVPKFCSELSAKFYGDLIQDSNIKEYFKFLPTTFLQHKYSHIFESQLLNIKDLKHSGMDFWYSPAPICIFIFILILIFILISKKYKA